MTNQNQMSLLTQEALRVLARRPGPCTANEMRDHLAAHLQGAVLYGDVYNSLQRLVRAGLVETRCDRVGHPCRIFWPTPLGRDLTHPTQEA